MKIWLVLQEGPGAGASYPLDPYTKPVFLVGRATDCDIPVADHRASRHHGVFRWNGSHWEVIDQGSTNGTYVNGLQVHGPYDLRLGDRITIGETTMVLREFEEYPPTPVRQRGEARPRSRTAEGPVLRDIEARAQRSHPQSRPRPADSTASSMAFWFVQGVVAAAIVCLASGAFLPWLRVTGSLSRNLQPLLQGLANIVEALSGSDSIFHISQTISGQQGYGKLMLGVTVISLVTWVVDIFWGRRSVVPGMIYLVAGLLAAAAMSFDLINYYRFYEQIQSLSLLFGVRLADVIELFGQFIEIQITPMVGLFLTGIGLVLLLAVGAARLTVWFLVRDERK